MRKLMKYGIWILLIVVTIGIGYNSLKVSAAGEKFKVAFLYGGAVGDAGWYYAHDQGRRFVEKTVPNVETTYVEGVPEGADAERVLTELCEKGNKMIFACSFGYMDYVQKVASKYPDVIFMHSGGYKVAKNVGTYFGRDYEGRYLTGIVAGKFTKANKIGFVAAFPIPEVIRGINGFALGVKKTNPKAKIRVIWTNTWYNPATEKDAANSLISAGADLMGIHMNTPACLQAAEEKGAYGVAFNSDMRAYAPKAILVSAVWNWGPYYAKTVRSGIDGTWKSDQYWGGIKDDGIIDIGPYGPMVPGDIRIFVEKERQLILKDDAYVFTGPIKDQSGAVKVKKGQKMTDEQMLHMNWFVDNIEGVIPGAK